MRYENGWLHESQKKEVIRKLPVRTLRTLFTLRTPRDLDEVIVQIAGEIVTNKIVANQMSLFCEVLSAARNP